MGILGFSQVRHAVPRDEDAIVGLIRIAHHENGLFPLAENKVREMIRYATGQQGNMIGLIDGSDGQLEASICLVVEQDWYTYAPGLFERWCFVRPDCRRSTHAKKLIEFAKTCADTMGVPLLMGIVSTQRTEAKVRLYERQMQYVGGYFMHRTPLPAALRDEG